MAYGTKFDKEVKLDGYTVQYREFLPANGYFCIVFKGKATVGKECVVKYGAAELAGGNIAKVAIDAIKSQEKKA